MVAAGEIFPVEVLMKSPPGPHSDFAREPNIVISLELAGLEDDLEMGRATSFFDGGDLVEDAIIVARQKNTAINHHIDLIRAISGSAPEPP